MIKKVRKMIEEHHMIEPGDKIIVGVSGGADSVCLLLVLNALREELNFDLKIVHVNHLIRGKESSEDANFVIELGARLGLTRHMMQVDVPAFCNENKIGLEEGARILRYRKFAEVAKSEGAKIALAHHMEDNAETILFQLARGSSLAGLCGMRPVRVAEDGVCYIRPFLNVSREQIEWFLHHKKQDYRIDSTNADNSYSRNYIRNHLISDLHKVNCNAVLHINETATKLSDIRDFLEVEIAKVYESVVQMLDGNPTLDVALLATYHKTMQKEVVYKFIAELLGGKKDITTKHVEQIFDLCSGQSGNYAMLPKGVMVRKEYDKLCTYVGEDAVYRRQYSVNEEILSELMESEFPLKCPLQEGKEVLSIRFLDAKEISDEIPQKTYTKWLDYDKIKTGFCIRTRESGDYIINDALGHRKKLKQYFIDEKIPVSRRDKTWLLTQDHLVIWVIGGRISEHVKVTKDTKTILEITYDGGR